ncbi:MAG: DUF547 domain-containing protein [Acidobacteria bacterium]|nr:DUF547 domain-containing protein [Acidobacteriota bacterium]
MFSHARRWERLGVWKTAAINQVCVAAYYLGVSPSRIQGWYDGGKGGLRGGNSGGREEKLKNRKILPLLGGLVLVAGAGVWFLARTTQPRMLRFAAGGRFSGGAFSYAEYATVLRTHVDGQGMVNYEGLLADRPMLDTFAAVLGQLDPSLYEQWSAEAQIAFWINAYNALALETILNHYPIRLLFSVRWPIRETASSRFPASSTNCSFRCWGAR